MARDMMLTPDEYMAIMRLLESSRESEGASLALRESRADSSASPSPRKKPRKITKYNRAFGRMLKQVKQTSRLKDGSYRKGWSSAKEMSKAHKLTKKMLKR